MNLPQGWTTSLVGEHRYIVSPEGDLQRDFKQQNLRVDSFFRSRGNFQGPRRSLGSDGQTWNGRSRGVFLITSLIFLKTYKTSSAFVSG